MLTKSVYINQIFIALETGKVVQPVQGLSYDLDKES